MPGPAPWQIQSELRPNRDQGVSKGGERTASGSGLRDGVVSEWLSWPRTVADAVERVLQIVDDVPATPVECEALGETISDQFGLQSGNLELLEACGFDAQSPGVVAEIIITQAREEQSRRRRGLN